MKTAGKILIGIGTLAVVGFLYANWPALRGLIRLAEPQAITAHVKLINRCDIASSSFIVADMRTGRRAQFSNGMARLETVEGSYLQLRLASRYADVTFNGEQQRAARQMRMTASCQQGERMRRAIDGLGSKFGAD